VAAGGRVDRGDVAGFAAGGGVSLAAGAGLAVPVGGGGGGVVGWPGGVGTASLPAGFVVPGFGMPSTPRPGAVVDGVGGFEGATNLTVGVAGLGCGLPPGGGGGAASLAADRGGDGGTIPLAAGNGGCPFIPGNDCPGWLGLGEP
jgi:hypothetical protein